jgi:hypothetical protein
VSNDRASASSRVRAADLARSHARQAILRTVRETGGQTVTRPVFRDRPELDMTVTDAEPIAALYAAAAVGHALRRITCEYVRRAREDGHSWPHIGAALGLAPAAGDGRSAAVAAYDQVTGKPGFRTPVFAWVCPACRSTVLDRGPEAGHPGDCEEGHAKGCPRLAAAVTAWDAQRSEEDIR